MSRKTVDNVLKRDTDVSPPPAPNGGSVELQKLKKGTNIQDVPKYFLDQLAPDHFTNAETLDDWRGGRDHPPNDLIREG